MPEPKTTRKVYSAEELRRLRGSQSQPRLRESIEEKDGEDAETVKEHVLRGSKSFSVQSYRSRAHGNTLRVPSSTSNNENAPIDTSEAEEKPLHLQLPSAATVLGEIAPNGQMLRSGPFKLRPSPTPSLKRKKAEAIVKAHGSPTHVRVTAGGRIVPSEQSPLCHPRFGYSAIKANGGLIKSVAPNHRPGEPQWTRATEHGFVAQDVYGNFCQIINGTIMPLPMIDGGYKTFIEAPNVGQPGNASTIQQGPPPRISPSESHVIAPGVSVDSQIAALDLQYAKWEHELSELNKGEVRNGRNMARQHKEAVVRMRRELVTNMDKARKAIKELKNLKSQPPPNAPRSPRVMAVHHRPSPPGQNRSSQMPPRQRVNNNFSQPLPQAPYGGQYFQPGPLAPPNYMPQQAPLPEEIFSGQSWNVPPASVFMPPAFDGSAAPALTMGPLAPLPMQLDGIQVTHQRNEDSIAQLDGPMADFHIQTPDRNHAVSIKAPEEKNSTKSSLNPMSPAYKPTVMNQTGQQSSRLRAPTPMCLMQNTQHVPQRSSAATTDTVTPSREGVHLHSSSVASLARTEDFFPHNTHEYSIRHHEHAHYDPIEAKESNFSNADSSATPAVSVAPGHAEISPHSHKFGAPAVPPGTPVDSLPKVSMPLDVGHQQYDMTDREANNISPKSKREWIFVQEQPSHSLAQKSSSPLEHNCQEDTCAFTSTIGKLDLLHKPREWIEGFQAGLQRQDIGDGAGDYLHGYVQGILKSTPPASSNMASTRSPVRPTSRRPSPAIAARPSGHSPSAEQRPFNTARLPLEMNMQNLDTLKQALYASHNETAIMTPAADGPHINNIDFNLGAWTKAHAAPSMTGSNHSARITDVPSFPVPSRESSLRPRRNGIEGTMAGFHDVISRKSSQTLVADDAADSKRSQMKDLPQLPEPPSRADSAGPFLQAGGTPFSAGLMPPASPTLSTMSLASSSVAAGSAPNTGHRVTSLPNTDSSMQRQWPGSRIMTPTEWKTGSSVAHAAGLATGYFSHAQFDGSQDAKGGLRAPSQAHGLDSLAPLQRVTSVTSNASSRPKHSRFQEGSLDGISSPPMSPVQRSSPVSSPPMSPSITPRATPSRRKDSTPGKGSSPAKAQFQSIAEKVGIKVSTTGAGKSPDAASGSAA